MIQLIFYFKRRIVVLFFLGLSVAYFCVYSFSQVCHGKVSYHFSQFNFTDAQNIVLIYHFLPIILLTFGLNVLWL